MCLNYTTDVGLTLLFYFPNFGKYQKYSLIHIKSPVDVASFERGGGGY